MTPSRYGFLTSVKAVAEWARRLVSDLNTRDAEIERRLISEINKALENPQKT